MPLQHFLLIYDLANQALVSMKEFGNDTHRAATAYTEAERSYRSRSDHENFEIVLVGADSIDTLRVTHSRYFRTEDPVPFAV